MENINLNEKIVPTGKVLFDYHNVEKDTHEYILVDNMFVTAGKNSVASRLIETASKGMITYCGLGTGITAPAAGDIELQTEIYRKLISVRSVSGNIATFQTYFTTAEANGTLKEAGLFGDDATDTANSGTLFCRTAINRTKTSSDTLTLSWAVTIG
jgi:hypothetical protein